MNILIKEVFAFFWLVFQSPPDDLKAIFFTVVILLEIKKGAQS